MYNEWKKKLKPVLILFEVVFWVCLFFLLDLKYFLLLTFIYFLGQLRERIVSDPDRILRVFNRAVYISETPKENGQKVKKFQFLKHNTEHPASHIRRLHINQPGGPKRRAMDQEAIHILKEVPHGEITNQLIDKIFDELAYQKNYVDKIILENKHDYADEKRLFRRRMKDWLGNNNGN